MPHRVVYRFPVELQLLRVAYRFRSHKLARKGIVLKHIIVEGIQKTQPLDPKDSVEHSILDAPPGFMFESTVKSALNGVWGAGTGGYTAYKVTADGTNGNTADGRRYGGQTVTRQTADKR